MDARTMAEVRYKAASERIFDQMQRAREEMITSLGPTDVDNGRTLQVVIEKSKDPLPRLLIHRVKGFIDHHPVRFIQQDSSKDQ